MKLFRKMADWVSFRHEIITVFGVAILMCLEVRTTFEWILFLLLAGIIGAIMKLRVYLAEKENREIQRESIYRNREVFERFLEQQKNGKSNDQTI